MTAAISSDPVREWQARLARRAVSRERWITRTIQLIELATGSHIADLREHIGDYAYWIRFTARHPDAVDPSLLPRFVRQFARLATNLGQGQEHTGTVLHALDEAITLQLRVGAPVTDLYLAKAAYLRTQRAESDARREALRSAVAHAPPGSAEWADAMIATCWYELDVSRYRRALRAARMIRDRVPPARFNGRYECAALAWEGVALFTSFHDLDLAERLLHQACRYEDRMADDPTTGEWVAMAYHYLARIAEIRGHHRTAMRLYLHGQRIAAGSRESLHADTFEQLRVAELLTAAGLYTEAREHLDRAYTLVRTFSDHSSARLQVDLGYATLDAAAGNPRQAIRTIDQARHRARSVGFYRGELLCQGYLLALAIRLRAFWRLPGLAIGLLGSALVGELRRNSLPRLIARTPGILTIVFRRTSRRRRSRTPDTERIIACACDLHGHTEGVASIGVVREFHSDEGWGVIDGPDVPGGCWVHFSAIATDGYRQLTAAQRVTFRAEPADQDGFGFRAVKVWTGDVEPPFPQPTAPSDAYFSSLVLNFDEPPDR